VIERANKAAEEAAAKTGAVPEPSRHSLSQPTAHLRLAAAAGERKSKVVSERLGHAKVSITLDVYSHVLPTMQDAAAVHMERLQNAQA
jgi:integrase